MRLFSEAASKTIDFFTKLAVARREEFVPSDHPLQVLRNLVKKPLAGLHGLSTRSTLTMVALRWRRKADHATHIQALFESLASCS